MKYFLSISFLFTSAVSVFAQTIERKIIIENGNYYYTTIDEEFQVATLHTGKVTEKLSEGKKLALPAGRNFDVPVIPFSWDLSNGFIYAINFLVHPLNDRNEALKKIKLSTLQEWDSTVTINKMLMTSVDFNTFTMNDPYLYITKRSNVLNNFYFDAIAVSDTSYCMVIGNNGEISVWNYNGKTWKHSEPVKQQVDGYFSLFSFKNKVYIHFHHGFVEEILLDKRIGIKTKRVGTAPVDGILIDDRDAKTIRFLSNNNLNTEIPLNELIKNKCVTVL